MKARLIATDRIAADAASFTFELHDTFSFEAGQTCDFTIPSPRYQDERGSTRTFSIASSPGDIPRLLVATRLTGSAFKRTLLEAGAGLEVEVDGPYGSFVLHKNTARPAVFFAGGIGITPFRSIVKDATERHLAHRMLLFYSNRTAASTAFLSDLEGWQRTNPKFRLIATITDAPPGGQWSHETGMMDAAFIKPHLGDASNAIYYLAGPAGFVKGMQAALEKLEADPDDIRTEEFPGY
ncbi:MAG: FAD-dependent oxidoreductase [Betaproteobacteria bacterium]